MLINLLEIHPDSAGNITTVSVTDGNDVMTVTPYQIFEALAAGRMESQTARLTVYGIDILVNSEIVPIDLQLKTKDKKLVRMRLGIDDRDKKQLAADKQYQLQEERKRFLAKEAKRAEERAASAEEIRANAPKNLTQADRIKMRQEAIRNNKK
jgi:hypothetical protein